MPLNGAMCPGIGGTTVALGGEYTLMLSVVESCAYLRSGVTGAAPEAVGTLVGNGGVGIFQLFTYSWLLRLLFVENIDFALSVVLRKKSVLKPPPSAIGMGSEMVGL